MVSINLLNQITFAESILGSGTELDATSPYENGLVKRKRMFKAVTVFMITAVVWKVQHHGDIQVGRLHWLWDSRNIPNWSDT